MEVWAGQAELVGLGEGVGQATGPGQQLIPQCPAGDLLCACRVRGGVRWEWLLPLCWGVVSAVVLAESIVHRALWHQETV
jgi:hypothetical protein